MRKQEELIELSGKDLKERLDAEMIALTRMRINHSITPLDNSGLLKEKRRDIARINTELRARELKKNNNREMETRNLRKERIGGVVFSNKMDKTVTVAVKWKEKHPIYGKFVNKTRKFHAHDEKNDCNIGDTVRIMETRPLSKKKRWRVVEVIERAK